MNLLDQPPEIRSVLAFWQMLRGLGFESDDLYVVHEGGKLLLHVSGDNGFAVGIGYTKMPQAEFVRRWMELAEDLPSVSGADMKANYERYATPERAAQVLDALYAAGIHIPNDPKRLHLN